MATYYVDTAGNDANSGLTTALAWQTMDKVNAFAFAAGDSILFKKGQTFAHQITCTRSGTAGAWITYGAYGTGARPIIDGSANHIGAVLVNAPYHHLRFEGLDFTGSTAGNYSTVNALSHDLYFYDCIFRDSQYFGYQGWSTSGSNIYNQTVSHCEAYDNANSGICISSNTGADGPHDCIVEYCTAHDNGTTLWLDHGIYCRYGVTIRYNDCYNQLKGGGIKINSETITTSPYDPVVYGNKCWGNFIGIYCVHVRARVYNNLFYGNEHNVEYDGDTDDVVFVFNTILNATTVITGAEGIAAFSGSVNFTGSTIENNLIIQDRAVSAANIWRAVGTARLATIVANNTINYNVVYTDATVGTDIFTDPALGAFNWTEWLALASSPDANSTFLLALPDIISRYTDVGIASTSSNIYQKGVAIAGITTDKNGVVRPNPPSPGWTDIAAAVVVILPGGPVVGASVGSAAAAAYELRILTAAGVLVHQLSANPGGQDLTRTGFIELAYTNQINSYGVCSFVLPGTHLAIPSLTERCQIEIWREDRANGLAAYRDWSGFFLDEERYYADGQHLFRATCYSDAFQLQDRNVLYRADTTNRSSFTTAKAETILKTLATYNLTASASVANGREVDGTMTGISVEADGGRGNTIDNKCAWDGLLGTMQKIAAIAGGDFSLVKTAAAAWEFRWGHYNMIAGGTYLVAADRTATVIFSTDLGNMGDPRYSKTRSTKKTSVTVGGQGQGAARSVENRTGNGYTTTANYEEFFNGSSQAQTTTGLQDIGDRRLATVKDVEEFTFTVLPTPATVYGRHYFLGDRVTAVYLTVTATPKIVSIAVSLDKTGQETITPELSYVG